MTHQSPVDPTSFEVLPIVRDLEAAELGRVR
jgi:hypothetical protein